MLVFVDWIQSPLCNPASSNQGGRQLWGTEVTVARGILYPHAHAHPMLMLMPMLMPVTVAISNSSLYPAALV